jgi:hypothetical protein
MAELADELIDCMADNRRLSEVVMRELGRLGYGA